VLATQTTGNLWFVLPRIAPPPGGVDRVGFLMLAHRGLIELHAGDGRPFLAADGTLGGVPLFATCDAAPHADWIPVFRGHAPQHEAMLTWLTPHDERGWLLRCTVRNTGPTAQVLQIAYTLRWGATFVSTYDRDPLHGTLRLLPNGWGGGIGLAWATARTEFGLGIGCTPGGAMHLRLTGADGPEIWAGDPAQGPERAFPPGTTAELTCRRDVLLAPESVETFDLFLSIAPTPKAACLDARYLREQGFPRWYEQTTRALHALNAELPAALAEDPPLAALVRRNRLFCYFYSLGRTLDTEEICPVTSRSSDYYVSAAYWDRDSLLWSFPTILDMDRALAATMLECAFGRQGRNIGIHSRFIDGAMCEPGFELDELCAPVLALDRYLTATEDWGVFERLAFASALRRIERMLDERRHPAVALFSTDYLPTDDLAAQPYCIYDNVLVWRMCGALERIMHAREEPEAAQRWADLRREIAAAIREHGTREHAGRRQFIWTTDLKGACELYDEPPGSLALLAALGFVTNDDPVFQATCDWIYSPQNPFYFAEVDEIGCRHEPHPWVLAVANSLLLPHRRAGALELLRRLKMDMGLACEAVHEQTGLVVSGRHFATCAGFLCHAIVTAVRAGVRGGSAATDRDCGAARPRGV
jgi:uncharacterized protein